MVSWNPREVSIIVRDALQQYYDTQSGQTGPTTLIAELEQEANAGLRSIQSLVDDMARQERIWLGNDMTATLEDQEAAIGGTFSRARWLEIKAIFDAFKTWMRTPIVVVPGDEEKGIEEVAVMPIVVVSRRANPVEKAVAPVVPTMLQP